MTPTIIDVLLPAALAGGALGAAALEGAHVARLVIAGGDTSSRWLRGTGFRRLDLVGRAGVNGVLCRLHAPGAPTNGLEVAFKGGQVGGDDYLVAMAEGSGDLVEQAREIIGRLRG